MQGPCSNSLIFLYLTFSVLKKASTTSLGRGFRCVCGQEAGEGLNYAKRSFIVSALFNALIPKSYFQHQPGPITSLDCIKMYIEALVICNAAPRKAGQRYSNHPSSECSSRRTSVRRKPSPLPGILGREAKNRTGRGCCCLRRQGQSLQVTGEACWQGSRRERSLGPALQNKSRTSVF